MVEAGHSEAASSTTFSTTVSVLDTYRQGCNILGVDKVKLLKFWNAKMRILTLNSLEEPAEFL